MADPFTWTALAGATVMGMGFLVGGQVVQETEHLAVKAYNFIKSEFANDRKGKNDGNELSENHEAKNKLTLRQRQILNDIVKGSKKK